MVEKLEVEGLVKHQGDPYTVELSRGQKGGYGWTIKVRGDLLEGVLGSIAVIDSRLREAYLAPENQEKGE